MLVFEICYWSLFMNSVLIYGWLQRRKSFTALVGSPTFYFSLTLSLRSSWKKATCKPTQKQNKVGGSSLKMANNIYLSYQIVREPKTYLEQGLEIVQVRKLIKKGGTQSFIDHFKSLPLPWNFTTSVHNVQKAIKKSFPFFYTAG